MKRLITVLGSVGFVAMVAGACDGTLPGGVAPTDPSFARAAAYTSVDIGAQFGSYSSSARGVNDAGSVAGSTCCGLGAGAFATVSGAVVPLAGERGAALAISNGSPTYVVGYAGATSLPVRWRLDDPTQPTPLGAIDGASWGAARGVNDAGAAVGNSGNVGAMWAPDGTPTAVTAPSGFVRGEGRGINNAGHAVFVFFAAGSEQATARGYLRLASGVLIELPPENGDVTTYANGVSEEMSGMVFVAGTTRSTPYDSRSVRWQVNATTGQIVGTEVRAETSHGLAASTAGAVAGFLESNALHTPRFAAYLWRGASLMKLNPPRSGSDGRAWAMSHGGAFVAGEAIFGGTRHAVRWTIASP